MPSDETARPERRHPVTPGQPAATPPPTAKPAGEPLRGPDLARAALEAAQKRTAERRATRKPPGALERRKRGYSGPGPDPRDPQLIGALLGKLIKDRGWQKPNAEAKVFGSWEKVVGPDIAAHCRPVKLDDGELTVEAESTAWATQLRLMTARLLAQIAKEIGHNVVKRLNIHGPSTGRGYQGPRWVRDRPGPRDQYE
ncbi:DciA family protein [Longispora urticae]